MSLHDAYARRTPFEVAFPDRSVVERLSSEVAAEAEGRGSDDSLLEVFVTTAAAGQRVREMSGPDAQPESGYPFASLLYHAVHFQRAGAPLYLLATDATRRLTGPDWSGAEPTAGAGAPQPPTAAGYLQLPQHLIWTGEPASEPEGAPEGAAGGAPGAARAGPPPESLDGAFWTATASGLLNVLPVSGLLPDRPGFAALPLPPAPLADAHVWLEATARPSGDDFSGALPGGEIDRLYSVRAAGEILKLLARFFAVVADATRGDAQAVRLERRLPEAGPPEVAAGAPRPSGLPYTRVSLGR